MSAHDTHCEGGNCGLDNGVSILYMHMGGIHELARLSHIEQEVTLRHPSS